MFIPVFTQTYYRQYYFNMQTDTTFSRHSCDRQTHRSECYYILSVLCVWIHNIISRALGLRNWNCQREGVLVNICRKLN